MAKDYYQTLGVTKASSADEIRKAFKKLARKYHPDVNPGDKKAEDKFKEITEAYEVLGDPQKKKKYDTYGTADFEGFPGGGGGRSYTYNYNPGGQAKYSSQFDLGDLGDIFGDIFGGAAGGAGASGASYTRGRGGARRGRTYGTDYSQPEPRKGQDFNYTIDLDFLEAVQGAEKKIRLPNGTTFSVKIPAGLTDGQKIRLAGKGEPGIMGGPAGDLFIEPRILPHAYFRRNGFDIELDVPLSLKEALEGAKIRIPTIDGPVEMKIPANSQSGQKLRLRGKGLPNSKTKEKGDQYIILQIKIPPLTESQTKTILDALPADEADPRSKFWA